MEIKIRIPEPDNKLNKSYLKRFQRLEDSIRNAPHAVDKKIEGLRRQIAKQPSYDHKLSQIKDALRDIKISNKTLIRFSDIERKIKNKDNLSESFIDRLDKIISVLKSQKQPKVVNRTTKLVAPKQNNRALIKAINNNFGALEAAFQRKGTEMTPSPM